MRTKTCIIALLFGALSGAQVRGEAMLQLFNQSWNEISAKMPELAEAGYTALWLPPAAKANSQFSAGYDNFDPFDLGDKDQKGTVATRYGTKDDLIRMVQTAHRFGIRVYFDNIMNHRSYDVPGYDAFTPITVYPGLLPEDFHLRVTSDGFYRKWDNISDWGNVWQIQNRNFSDLIDLSQESPVNNNFGLTEGSTSPKLSFVRQPTHPEYYPDLSLPAIKKQGGANSSWHPFNGTNSVPYAEDTASFIIRAAQWFINETKCDGLRLDAVKHVPSSFFGAYLSATDEGYTGAIQTMFDYVHGYGYTNPVSGFTELDDNRNSCFDAEAIRNDALIFGEHLGEPPSFTEYTGRGMRLVDAPLANTLNDRLGSAGTGLQGLDQIDFDGYGSLNHFTRVMYAQSHDNGYSNHRDLQLPYMFMREGIGDIYSDGWRKSATCTQCGGEFPRNANANYLGEFSDNKMPEIATFHNNLARGGTRSRWADNDVVAFERYDYREGSGSFNDPTLTTALFVMNDNYGNPGDVSFDDGVPQSDAGMPTTCYPVVNSRGRGLVVAFPPGSILVDVAASANGSDRACSKVLVRNATTNFATAMSSTNAANPVDRLVYVQGQTIPAGGGAIEFKIPSGGYIVYAYQGPEPSRPVGAVWTNDVVTFRQGGQDVPRMLVRRTDGPDGDTGFNPIYPYKARGSVNADGSIRGGANVSNLTYAIDIPVITNSTGIDILARTDASTENILLKLDGGNDLNSHMKIGPTNTLTGAVLDLRDNKPGSSFDMFLGYEQPLFVKRRGPEKFAAANIANNTVISLGAETYSYTIGDGSNVVVGAGGGANIDTSTADWVYHDPGAGITATGPHPSTQRPFPPGTGTVELWVKVGYGCQISTGAVYYTTDGSNPEGAFGTGKGTTQVVPLSFAASDAPPNSNIDWWKGTIPGQTSGTTVKYKVALYNEVASCSTNPVAAISDADTAKLYGMTQFAITNLNPATVRNWIHDDMNPTSTSVGLEPGFHVLRARAFLPRPGKASVYNTYVQTFYYDPAPPQGVIAFPATDGTALQSQQYGFVIRAESTCTEVQYNIVDPDPSNDSTNTGNGVGIWATASRVSPNAGISQTYPNYPLEYRFNYVAIPSNGNATVKVRLKEVTTATFTNRFTELTRTVVCAAPPQTLNIAFPAIDGETLFLDQNDKYTTVTCFTDTLGTDINKFTISIDGSTQARTKADGTPLYTINNAFCGAGKHDLRFDWSGMSAGQHIIEITYDDEVSGLHLQATRTVNVITTGISVIIIQPPDADAAGRSPYTIVLPDKTNALPSERSFTITAETSTSVTNVLIGFNITTNAFSGGVAGLDTNFVGTTKRWNFAWTNMVAGTFNIRADAFGGGSNTAFRTVKVVFSQIYSNCETNNDDCDSDGISNLLETTPQPLPSTQSETWNNSEVHVWKFSGRSDPFNVDTDGDGLPDALELGIGPGPAAVNTDTNADLNGDGYKNFIPDADPPKFNTVPDNSGLPGFDLNKSRTDQLRGSMTDPANPDTDFDGLLDGIEDANRNGRVDIALTNSTGTVTNFVQFPPTVYNTSKVDRNAVSVSYPNAKWTETDPSNSDTDGDGLNDGSEDSNHNGRIDGDTNTNRVWNAGELWTETDPLNPDTDGDGLPDGWEVQHGLNPWDNGSINMNTGGAGNPVNGANGDPDGDGCNNLCEFINNTDPWTSNNAPPPPANSITIGPGPVIGSAGGVTWNQEFQDWTAADLKALDEYDGNGQLKRGRDVYPWYDGYDWSRDILAFYARDGGADNKYYFRLDFHDLGYKAEQANLDVYVAINFGVAGDSATANIVLPDAIDTSSDMGWKIVVAAYDQNNGRVYVKRNGIDTTQGAFQQRNYTPDPAGGGFVGSYYRSDLDAVEFAISRQALIDAGWNGVAPLQFQVYTTHDGTCNTGSANCPGDTPKSGSDITDTIYDDDIPESDTPSAPNNVLHYWFTSINQNPVNIGNYTGSLTTTNHPGVVKLAVLLHGNQAILPASVIQSLISNSTTRTSTGGDTTFDPGNQPTGYYRALESAQVFGTPLNLHLSGSLISALQWASSTNASVDGPKFNQRIASLVASNKVALLSGMFADHIAPYFTGAVNKAAIQLQDDITRRVYGSNSVSAASPVYLSERVADGKTMTDLAANSGHTSTILDQMVHMWWWGEQLYGFGNGRQVALSDAGYEMQRFNGMNAFLISGASDQMYLNNDLGTTTTLRELLNRKAMSSVRDQIVILGDNWETAGSIGGGNRNADALNLNLRWIANHPWIKVVTLDKFASAQVDLNNDGTINPNNFSCVDGTSDNPCVNDRGTTNFTMQAKDLIRHNTETNYNNWYYGSALEESFFAKKPPIRFGSNAWFNIGHVLSNGTMLATAWTNAAGTTGLLSNLAKLVYLNGVFETAFHVDDNNDASRFSTGDYKNPDTTGPDSLIAFSYKPNSHVPRQASIIAAAGAWAASNTGTTTVVATQDVDNDGEPEYILSNNRLYAVFESGGANKSMGGRLIAAFARDTNSVGGVFQLVGNLANTPDFEDENEGDANLTNSVPYAYRCSGFKDWFAVTNGVNGTKQYVNDLYTVTTLANGFRFASSDSKITKTITLANGAGKLEANYQLSGITTLYTRHGLSPDALALLYFGQLGLTGPSNATGKVTVRNLTTFSDSTTALAFADAGHSNCNYNALANDNNNAAGYFNVAMRNLAQTQQIELMGSNTFSFAMEFGAIAGGLLDTDNDGLPDVWEQQYGLDWQLPNGALGDNGAAGDPDGDGQNNLAEYISGTIPTNAASVLRIINVTRAANGDVTITWQSVAGKNYDVWATTNLNTGFGGAPISGTLASGGATTSYIDVGAAGSNKHYKVRVLP